MLHIATKTEDHIARLKQTNTTKTNIGYCNVGGENALVKPHTYTMYI